MMVATTAITHVPVRQFLFSRCDANITEKPVVVLAVRHSHTRKVTVCSRGAALT